VATEFLHVDRAVIEQARFPGGPELFEAMMAEFVLGGLGVLARGDILQESAHLLAQVLVVGAAQQVEGRVIPERECECAPGRSMGGFQGRGHLRPVRREMAHDRLGSPHGGLLCANARNGAGRRLKPAAKDKTRD
jgi:hypothetical protein